MKHTPKRHSIKSKEVLEISLGDSIFLVPLPSKPDPILRKYLKFHFTRKLRKIAEIQMIKEAKLSKWASDIY